jgi:3-phosphoglycerate kinase
LGSCIGSASAKFQIFKNRVSKIKNSLEALRYVEDSQCALMLLRSCFGLPKINFALRTMHESEVREAVKELDSALDDALKFIFNMQAMSPHERDQIALPFQNGFPKSCSLEGSGQE